MKSSYKLKLRNFRRRILSYKMEQRYVAIKYFPYYQALRHDDTQRSFACFKKHKCIFIHIPKTGGISIADALFNGDMLGGHFCMAFFRIIYGRQINNYYKFAVVRNPWDRVVSAYEYLLAGGMSPADKERANRIIKPYDDFNKFVIEWITPANVKQECHFVPQHEYICDSKGNIIIDDMGHFETIQDDFKRFRMRLNLPEIQLPIRNSSSRRRDYRSYYTDESAAVVASVYKTDILSFNYSFDPQ